MGLFGDYLGAVMGGTSKPKVPVWQDINLADQQQRAIDANLEALPDAQALASQTNTFNREEIERMLRDSVPNYDDIKNSASKNISEMIRGEIPTDVADRVQQMSAARSLFGGYSGSGMATNLTARDLGLTSLDLTAQGLSSADQWMRSMSSLFSPGMLNVTSMFVSPQQMFNATMANQENQWGVQWMRNQIKAMPDPQMEALGQFIGGIGDAAASYFVGSAATSRSSPQQSTPQFSGGGMGGGMDSSGMYMNSAVGSNPYAQGGIFSQGYQMGGSGAIQGAGQAGGGAAMGAGAMCCFIFLESYNGNLPWWVRECRDEYYSRYPMVAHGYKRMARWLVPAMKKYPVVRWLVNAFMVTPITKYGGWLKNVSGYEHCSKYGIYKAFWFAVWKLLGSSTHGS